MCRFLTDENIHGDIVRGLRRRDPDLDIERVQEAGLVAAKDPEILERAAAEGRILLTRDHNTMVGFAYARVKAGQPMPGVLVLREDLPIGRAIEEILVVTLCSQAEEWKDRVECLPLSQDRSCGAVDRRNPEYASQL